MQRAAPYQNELGAFALHEERPASESGPYGGMCYDQTLLRRSTSTADAGGVDQFLERSEGRDGQLGLVRLGLERS